MTTGGPPYSSGPEGGGHPERADLQDVVDAINRNTRVDIEALRVEIRAEMNHEMQEMRAMLAAALGLDAMTSVLENGFDSLSEQLRQLVPQSTSIALGAEADRAVAALRASLKETDFDNSSRLENPYTNVPYIGAFDPAPPKQKGRP